ncbi:MAG: helix-turn-helix domain-containing protein [Actinophytocola sp.]|nr:helix-turn-helix domain-containing protein [Actinophytocola sp.]
MPTRTGPRRTRREDAGPLGRLATLAAERRRALRLTQRELAELAEVSERSIQALEAGKLSIRADILLKILDALGLALAALPKSHARRLSGAEATAVLSAPSDRSDRHDDS